LARVKIREIEAARLERIAERPERCDNAMVRLLARIIGAGMEMEDMLAHEVLARDLLDRRAVAPYAAHQIRAARALVRWSARELAERAGLSLPMLPTVQRLEAAEGVPSTSVRTLSSIKAALEKAGVEFTNSDAPGVTLRRPGA
jgi:hypothetical protein